MNHRIRAVVSIVDSAEWSGTDGTMAGVFRVPDQMLERIAPLVPAPAKVHRFGGGCPRVPDRDVLDAIFFVDLLRFPGVRRVVMGRGRRG